MNPFQDEVIVHPHCDSRGPFEKIHIRVGIDETIRELTQRLVRGLDFEVTNPRLRYFGKAFNPDSAVVDCTRGAAREMDFHFEEPDKATDRPF